MVRDVLRHRAALRNAWLLRRYAKVDVSIPVRFLTGALLIAASRLALIFGVWPIG
jgi:uncharacterized protein YutE (UPF0331/DUF86 family)